MSSGAFIVFEGGEGCGKSTQAELLAHRIDAVLTRQPGGTLIGAALREVLLDPARGEMSPKTEALLMAADRAQHEAELIGPELAKGRHVVCDRYVGSSIAYQGVGRALGRTPIATISEWATGGREPDLVVLLDLPVELARLRMDRPHDRMEQAGAAFHESVRDGFLALAEESPHWVVCDAALPIDELHQVIVEVCAARLGIPT